MNGGPGDELVDIVDDADRVVATVPRRQMRAERLRHRTVFVVVNGTDGRLLVHRRSADKDLWPGRWDVAVGGVLARDEDWASAAERELAEEIGVGAGASALHELGQGRYVDDDVDLVARCYRVITDGPFVFADGEVVEVRWVDRSQLDELLSTAPFVPDSLALLPPRVLLPLPASSDTHGG